MGVPFYPLQGLGVFRAEFNPGNYGFPALPFLGPNGVMNLAYGLENYLSQSFPFHPFFMDRTRLISKLAGGGLLICSLAEYISPFSSFQPKPFPPPPAWEWINVAKKSSVRSLLYTFSYRKFQRIAKKKPENFFQLPGSSFEKLGEGND